MMCKILFLSLLAILLIKDGCSLECRASALAGKTIWEPESVITCSSDDMVCGELTITARVDRKELTIYRTKCMTLQECSAIACPIDLFSNLSSSTNMDNIEVIECEKDCCDGQGCNVSIDDRLQDRRHHHHNVKAEEENVDKLMCHSGVKEIDHNGIVIRDEMEVKKCNYPADGYPLSSRCMLTEVITRTKNEPEQTVRIIAQCYIPAMCNLVGCSMMKRAVEEENSVMDSCEITCCETDECNTPSNRADKLGYLSYFYLPILLYSLFFVVLK